MDDISGPLRAVPEPHETWPPLPLLVPPPAPRIRWRLHAGLLAATFVTATMAGSWFWKGSLVWDGTWATALENLSPSRLVPGIPYALLLLAILGAHEMGHYIACRRYRVPATLPFFIPGIPMPIGTFGAVIRIRGQIPDRAALFDIAAAGPIAGFLVALPILIYGVATATVVPAGAFDGGLTLGPPLLSWLLERALYGGANLQVGSAYGAAWVGMLVTSMNLFPVGQLDGGHAVFALSSRAHRVLSWCTIAALAVLVAFQSLVMGMLSAYTLWLVALLLLRDRHPRLADETAPLGRRRAAVAVLLAIVFLLSTIPLPFSVG